MHSNSSAPIRVRFQGGLNGFTYRPAEILFEAKGFERVRVLFLDTQSTAQVHINSIVREGCQA